MALIPVNDPSILQHLESGETPVSDPSVLAQLEGGDNNDTPGTLKSAALGAMSGFPGAEAATSGVMAALDPNKDYAQVHQELESDRDKAWEAHPVAYGGGKAAGMVGTGVVAAATGGTSIPAQAALGAGTGALSAVDALKGTENVTDAAGDVAKGTAVGGVTGGLLGATGNVLSKIASLVPGLAKTGVAALTSKATKEDVETYLRNPDMVRQALDKIGRADKFTEVMNALGKATGKLSNKAVGKLGDTGVLEAPLEMASEGLLESRPEGIIEQDGLTDTITPIFDKIKATIAPNGVASTAEADMALKALDAQKQRLIDEAATHGGRLPENRLGEIIRDIYKTIKPGTWDAPGTAPGVKESQMAMRDVSGALNSTLKGQNPAYGKSMVPVAKNTELLREGERLFKPHQEGYTYSPSETTVSKMGQLLNDNSTEKRTVLDHLKDKSGFDFLKDANMDAVRQRLSNPDAGPATKLAGGLAGFVAGSAVKHPWLGAGAGRLVGGAVDGGQSARQVMDAYLAMSNGKAVKATAAALSKYGPRLIAAAKQGGNHLAATHFVLSTSEPDYQQLVAETQNNAGSESDHDDPMAETK